LNPIKKFKQWYNEEQEKTSVRIPSAFCLSTIGKDGYPNARFVSLKEIIDDKFVITGPLQSRKGKELNAIPKAALTFWWPETERQVRIQGDCLPIETELANLYFKDRNKASQIVSKISEQGEEISNLDTLIKQFETECYLNDSKPIIRPKDWSGFYIIPKRIEFMQFQESRFHIRELYTLKSNTWTRVLLQP